MKKYLIVCFSIVFIILGYYYITHYTSFYIWKAKDITTNITTKNKNFQLNAKDFQIKAINLGSSIPGHDDKEFEIDKKTYLRWFKLIKEMNINTIRVYTIESPDFYDALREYNLNNKDPLYLLQGMDVGDYEKNSTRDYFDRSLKNELIKDIKKMIDVIHGKRIIPYNPLCGSGVFSSDVSKWTLGYIIGTEWNSVTVEYTNRNHENDKEYNGEFLKTTSSARPFERILAEVGDSLFAYESKKYGEQRLVSFGNSPETDPFIYDEAISDYFNKFTTVDINNISTTDNVKSGMFASFQVFSGYPDYYSMIEGNHINTYQTYLKSLNNHYDIPFVVSEFGYSTARGETINFQNLDYGHSSYTEEQQGEMIISAINSMKEIGINNFIIYEWQDEWDKNVWNTMHGVETNRSQYWHDVQTSTQSFGILTFEDGKEKMLVTLDGNKNEWTKNDIILENLKYQLSSKYDTTYLYLLIESKYYTFGQDTIYIPFDITPKTGSTKTNNLTFSRPADFLLQIHDKNDSKLMVHERYNPLKAMYNQELNQIDIYIKEYTPTKDSPVFEDINQITSFQNLLRENNSYNIENKVTLVNTGYLIYGNGDPENPFYNSLSDFYIKDNVIEIRIPWNLLNFSDPSLMQIHDDYYENYGVEDIPVSEIYVGVGTSEENIPFGRIALKGWGEKIEYHERLKKSYYMLQKALKEG